MAVILSPGELETGLPFSTSTFLGFLKSFEDRIICDISAISQIWL